jgi:hypothetical protein
MIVFNLKGAHIAHTCCYPFLGFHKKKIILKMRKYKKIYQKIFERNPKNNRCEKRTGMLKKMIKLVEKVQKCKMLKFNSIFFTDESPVDK